MRDITHKQISLRTARAAGVVFCSSATIDLIKSDQLPKGNLFDVARAAGFLGAKNTPQLLPHCHPVSIDEMDMQFEFLQQELHGGLFGQTFSGRTGIVIQAHASSIGRTGIEMEVLMGVSVAALEIYDMLKPVDTGLEIGHIRLLEKKGGKSDRNRYITDSPTCAVLVCSDSTAAGQREDRSGKLINEMLQAWNADVKHYAIVPDDKERIQQKIREWVSEDIQFVFTTGGTGLGPRDNTVSAVKEILERDAEGIAEAMRAYGQMRTPLAMMSRSVAGSIANTLVVTLPGSSNGARESLEAILPAIFHAREMMKGEGHQGAHQVGPGPGA
ncbi:MAG TPA: bifunctional molybdenum cofactor biosynthesis protein MoaC/MoaB [Puia sp.]|nr:bifunctional molybdenum cofactor biosynthesis protein MoaC/MoaB [Puia sp.]